MKTTTIVLAAFALSVAYGQIRWDNLIKVADADVAAPALSQWREKIASDYRKDGVVIPTFSSWFELPFDSLKKLFPEHRFFAISWSERAAPGKEKQAVGLAGGEYTLACTRDGKIAKEIYHYGNYEAFGELLATAGVVIRNPDDAKLVWDGFCDLHQKHWQKQPCLKISDRVGHLGDNSINGVHYYYEVRLDPSMRITGSKLHADDTKRTKEK